MHTFLYQFKLLVRNRTMLFWTLLFPLILATFFNLALSKVFDNEGFNPARVAVVVNQPNAQFQALLDELSIDNENQLLDVQYTSLDNAKEKLNNDEVDGYLVIGESLEIIVNENGISQTIIQNIVDTYQQNVHTINTIATYHPQSIAELLQKNNDYQQNYFESENLASLDATVVYFYTLIGMTCMYGGFWGLKISTNIEANLSRQGTRIQVSPSSKFKLVFTGMLAAFVCQYLSVAILLLYLNYGLHVALGNQIGYIMILMAVGSYVGLTIGNLIGNLLRCSENTKISILTSSSLFCSFLSGMMIIDMKYLIQEYIPILSYINPVNLITDALYALYYYPTYERFFFNLSILGCIGLLLSFISIILSRRKKYESL